MRATWLAVIVSCLASGGCGGAAAESRGDGTGVVGAEGSSQPEGDIQVRVDEPREGQFLVVDEEGRMGFQTNVRLELETLPGTTGAAVQRFGRAIQTRMAEIRTCYDRAVASDPEVEGSLRLEVATDARGHVTSEVGEERFTQGRITQCVVRILRQLPRAEVPESSRVRVVLVASNTMAAGTRQVRERNEAESSPSP